MPTKWRGISSTRLLAAQRTLPWNVRTSTNALPASTPAATTLMLCASTRSGALNAAAHQDGVATEQPVGTLTSVDYGRTIAG
eukprot:1548725-Rhodomonas_salina.1